MEDARSVLIVSKELLNFKEIVKTHKHYIAEVVLPQLNPHNYSIPG